MTRRRVIFPHQFFDRPEPTKETTMTDPTPEPAHITNPDYVALELPIDTINVGCTAATFILTAAGDGKLAPQLAVNTDMGWYRMFLSREVFYSLLAQAEYFASLNAEQTKHIATKLHQSRDQ